MGNRVLCVCQTCEESGIQSEVLVGPIPRVPAKLKLPKGRDLCLSTNPLPLLTNEFLWAQGKSKELGEVKFSSPKPEEV